VCKSSHYTTQRDTDVNADAMERAGVSSFCHGSNNTTGGSHDSSVCQGKFYFTLPDNFSHGRGVVAVDCQMQKRDGVRALKKTFFGREAKAIKHKSTSQQPGNLGENNLEQQTLCLLTDMAVQHIRICRYIAPNVACLTRADTRWRVESTDFPAICRVPHRAGTTCHCLALNKLN
jgi:hypothetical protein